MPSRTNINGEHHHHHPTSSSSSRSNQNQNQNPNPNPNQNPNPNPNQNPNPNPTHQRNNQYPNDNSFNNYSSSRAPSSSSSASFKGCCCCLFLLLTFLGLLVLAVILIIVLAVKPKKPQFELQQVGVQYVGITAAPPLPSISSSITPSASLSFSIKMIFTASNPNKVGIKYSSTTFDVMYRGVPLGRASVPGFYQPAHSVREVQTTVNVDRVNLLQAEATDLVKDASLYDRVELRITGDVGAKIRLLDFTSPRVQVSVDCAIVISPKKQSLTYKQCGVDGLTV